ncbi:hypothetical protein [Parendozoicomonas haliclonae]|uniref:Uncharacterized protein n=1 Tax=Parendozoicomonas haliclonae TaxID=1960125 RepID=A0A1X7AJB7_9GAMM|nr:hypothetical protein [Parendozoicomonas haliclonae]SMA40708.1 hypothetical protein EHSB41UT_01229 [Parendozoicomonas haliclonae]
MSYAAAQTIPEPFQKLAHALNMPAAQDWQTYRRAFIQQWGREQGVERWQMPAVNLQGDQRHRVYEALEELGVISDWQPSATTYDYAIWPGAIVPTMKTRLEWLTKLWKQGIRFKTLVVLTGQRPLTDNIDNFYTVMVSLLGAEHASELFADPNNHPHNETEAARLLLHYTPLPDTMKNVTVVFADTPRKWTGDVWDRPHTGDTVEQWLLFNPEPGSVLLVTSQPSAHYQEAVFQQHLPAGFPLDTSTPALNSNASLAIILDGIATWLRSSPTPPTLAK